MTNSLTAAAISTTATSLPIVQLIMSFLGGGFVVALLNWVREVRSERKQRLIVYLQDQLRELYGPLHFFSKQNQELINLHNQHGEAYEREFIEQKLSGPCPKDATGKSEPERAIDIRNEYAERIRGNHDRMLAILEKNWSFIDDDDCEMFAQFMVDRARSEIEFDDKRVLKTPYGIFKRIGDGTAYTYRSEFVDRIQEKWQLKQKRLRALLRVRK